MHPIFRREVISAFIVQLFAIYSLSIFGAYYGIQLDDIGATALIIGVVFASRNFVQIFLRIPFSELSQIIGRKPLIISGIFLYSFSLGLLYVANHWYIIFIATLLTGIGMSLHWPALFSYIGDISGDDYGKINGILFQGQDIGLIVGSFMARYLLANEIVDLKGLFGVSFIVGMIGTLISAFILQEVLEDENRKHVDSKIKALYASFVNIFINLKIMSKQYPLGIIFLFELLVTFTQFFMVSFFPLLVVITLDFPKSEVANILLLSTLITILFKPYFGLIFDKWGY